MGLSISNYRSDWVDETGGSSSFEFLPTFKTARRRYQYSSPISTTITEVKKEGDVWKGTQTVRPMHVGGPLASTSEISILAVEVAAEQMQTFEEFLELIKGTPDWMKKDIPLAACRFYQQRRPTREQLDEIKKVLPKEHYDQFCVQVLDQII